MEDIQEVYTSTLQSYIDMHRPRNRTVFARLLMKMTDLRTLGSEHADIIFTSLNDKNFADTALENRIDRDYNNTRHCQASHVSDADFKYEVNQKFTNSCRRASYAGPISSNMLPIMSTAQNSCQSGTVFILINTTF